jgi:hypothetical protein
MVWRARNKYEWVAHNTHSLYCIACALYMSRVLERITIRVVTLLLPPFHLIPHSSYFYIAFVIHLDIRYGQFVLYDDIRGPHNHHRWKVIME